jgi:hypothetical protein
MSRSARRELASALVAFAVSAPGRAQDGGTTSDAARLAYDRGTAAFRAGQYAVAAREYDRADQLAPHPVALRWALVASVQAGDAVLGMTLVDRAAGRAADPELEVAVSQARAALEHTVAGLTLRCPPRVVCSASVDGQPVPTGERSYLLPGVHAVEIRAAGHATRRSLTLAPGAREEVVGEPPPAPASPAPAAAPHHAAADAPAPAAAAGISPVWFFVGVGATAVLGGVTVWSGIDTVDRNDAYLATRDQAGFDDGRAAQTRTNVLVGVTAASAVATALVGILAVRWSEPAPRPPAGASAWVW